MTSTRISLRPLHLLLCALCVSFFVRPYLPAQTQTLYSQSIQTALTRNNPNLEFLLLDLQTHQFLANTFPDQAISPGSLLKPFVALAYGATHHDIFPTITCHGHAGPEPDQCWKTAGHGPLTLPEAIAQSCNAYFLALARQVPDAALAQVSTPPTDATPEDLIGLTPRWQLRPTQLALAYADLITAQPSPTQRAILAGMRASATRGTAAHIGRHPGGVLAKTGTAPCRSSDPDSPCKATGDGLVLAVFPADRPTLILLVRQRATTGAVAAIDASRILTQLQNLHAY